MGGKLAGPKAESIVVFRRDDDTGESGFFECVAPLVGIELGGIEDFGVFAAVAPFFGGESVRPEMDKGVGLTFVPGELSGGGNRAEGHGIF